mmetsp:Transcript_5206/g.15287  ORF Transcript_5206/g.15287 Transcript_5206/m.15287 type:complete len:250 (+) Transcript_5206:1947-2696(+)
MMLPGGSGPVSAALGGLMRTKTPMASVGVSGSRITCASSSASAAAARRASFITCFRESGRERPSYSSEAKRVQATISSNNASAALDSNPTCMHANRRAMACSLRRRKAAYILSSVAWVCTILACTPSKLVEMFAVGVFLSTIARWPNRRAIMLSLACSASGDTATHIHVSALPPKAFCSRRVSLESRNGTCGSPTASAFTHMPSVRRLLLIWLASVRRTPVAPDLDTHSLPAKSTKYNCANRCRPPPSV